MDKIKSKMHKGNKHFVLGLSFVVFSLILSIYWGFTYADDTTNPPTIPSPVTNLVGAVNGNSIVLTWTNNSTNQDKFNISRRVSGSTSLISLALVPGPDATSYTDSSVTAGNTYDYQVEACLSGVGCSYMTEVVGIVVPSPSTGNSSGTTNGNQSPQAPPAPSNLRVDAFSTTTYTTNVVPLSWTNNSTAQDKFNLERKLSTATTWTTLPQIMSGTASYYMDSSAPIGNYYDYRLQACLSGSGCSPYVTLEKVYVPMNGTPNTTTNTTNTTTNTTGTTNTITDTTKPAAPTNLTATVDGNKVTLNWIDNSNNEAGFKIYRGPLWTDIGDVGQNVTTITYSGLAAGTYTYHLNAFNTNRLYSTITNDVSVTVGGTTANTMAPSAPSSFRKVVSTLSNAISLAWTNSSTTQDQISIEKKLSTATTWLVLTKLTGSTISYFMDNLVAAGVSYDYRIQACLAGICSSYVTLEKVTTDTASTLNTLNTTTNTTVNTTTNTTGAITTTTDITKPAAPTNLTATVDGNKVILKWIDNSNNELGFKIYRNSTDIGNVDSNVTVFVDQNRPAGNYTYRLNAFNKNNLVYQYSPISNDVSVAIAITAVKTDTTTPVLVPVATPKITTVTTNTPTTTPTPVSTTPTPTKITTENTSTAISIYPPTTTITPVVNPVAVSIDNKEAFRVETPTEIINNVTAILNIIPKLPETSTEVAQTEITPKEEPVKTQEEIKKEEVVKQEVVKLVYQDTNKDGISDYDSKYIYNMDPVKPSPVSSYGGKSINAGEKVLLGFDPSQKELAKVVTEDPVQAKEAAIVTSYKVQEIKLTEKKEIALKGQALPNSFVTLYIYSTPIMVTVKTDSNGEWKYVLDKELENGNHTVYTATVNNTGKIVAKSAPYSFVKTAEAVALQDVAPSVGGVPTTVVEKPGFLQSKNIFIITVSVLLMIGITLILIGLFSKKITIPNENN